MIRAVGEPGWSPVHRGVNEVSQKSLQYVERAPTYMNFKIVSPSEIEVFVRNNLLQQAVRIEP